MNKEIGSFANVVFSALTQTYESRVQRLPVQQCDMAWTSRQEHDSSSIMIEIGKGKQRRMRVLQQVRRQATAVFGMEVS